MQTGLSRTLMDTVLGYSRWAGVVARSRFSRPAAAEHGGRMHLVLLATDFPPHVSGGVYRPVALVKYAVALGWRVTVITCEAPDNAPASGRYLLDSIPQAVSIVRVKPSNLRPSFNWYPRIQGESLVEALSMVSCALDHLQGNSPSVVLASGPIFSSFVAAHYIAAHFGSCLVLDYRDEWTEWPFGIFPIGRSDYLWERRCLARADLVFFTTESQKENQLRVFPELQRSKCHVAPNGWEPADFLDAGAAGAREPSADDRFVISYVGVFGGHINTIGFLQTLESVLDQRQDLARRLRLRIVGLKDKKALDYLAGFRHADVVETIDQVPKPQANRMMKDSDALLLVYTGPFRRYIPGKLYDYLAAGPPILVFGAEGEACDIVRKLAAGRVVDPDRPQALEDALDACLRDQAHPRAEDDCRRQWLEAHTREGISGTMLSMIGSLPASGAAN